VDAAGIAIASSLNIDVRVFMQAIRNLNDGVALLNVAEGGLTGLRDIVFRLRELAEQSANGVLTGVQRQSIDAEGQALTSEYNRIISVTEFNGLKLLDGSLTNLTLQAGYETTGILTVSIGQQLLRNAGETTSATGADGTFQTSVSYTTGSGPRAPKVADLDGDGKLDIVLSNYTGSVSVLLGNGNGTFGARRSFGGGTGTSPWDNALADINGDGKLDIVAADSNLQDKLSVFLGNGNGSFQARVVYSNGFFPRTIAVGDLDGDGKLDVVTTDFSASPTSVFLGNGNGTFKARTSSSNGVGFISTILRDVSGDGKLDLITGGGASLGVALGNGNGSFQAAFYYASGAYGLIISDFNSDGKLDIASADGTSKVNIILGNGNGTFQARTSYSAGTSPRSIALGDVNGDGKFDLIAGAYYGYGNNRVSVLLSNGNGSFQARTSYAIASQLFVAVGDFSGDETLDIAATARNSQKLHLLLGNESTTITPTAATTTTLPSVSFLTQTSSLAALTTLASVQTSIENELANIGSSQSRLGTAISNLQQTRENYNAAESRIVDADIAVESANLVKQQILQNASSAILAQANQEPALLLALLKP